MPYTVRLTTIKPSNVKWYLQSLPVNQRTAGKQWHDAWCLANPNKLLSDTVTKPNANTRVKTLVFIDEAAYDSYRNAKASTPSQIDKRVYNLSHGIVTTKEIL